jgi:hypothetical protein
MVKLVSEATSPKKDLRVVPSLEAAQHPLLPLVEERLGKAIAFLGLEVGTFRRSPFVTLENAHCRLMLGWYGDETVLCSFESKSRAGFWCAGSPMQSFDLYLFLYLRLGAGVSEYLPCDWNGGGDRHLLCLDGIGAALVKGELLGPLQGDFSWSGEYAGLMAEKDGMYRRLLATMSEYKPEIDGICYKWRLGDPSWIGDARALLEVKNEK